MKINKKVYMSFIFITFCFFIFNIKSSIFKSFKVKQTNKDYLSELFKFGIPTEKPIFFGNPDKDGSWRIIHKHPDIIIQKRVDGIWSSKLSVTDSISTDVLHATENVEISGTSVITSITGSGITVTKNGNAVSLTVTSSGSASIIGAVDTPNSYSDGKLLISTGSGFEYTDLGQSNVIYNNGLIKNGETVGIDTSGGSNGQVLQHTGSGVQWTYLNSGLLTKTTIDQISQNEIISLTANTIISIEEVITNTNQSTSNIIPYTDNWEIENVKNSISYFEADSLTSGHFENSSFIPVTIGSGNTEPKVITGCQFSLEGESSNYGISSVIGNGSEITMISISSANGSEITILTGLYSVRWVKGIQFSENKIKLTRCGSERTLGVVLLIHSNTSDGSQVFTDSSTGETIHTITGVGNTSHATAQKKFGNSSIYFDGTGDALSIPNSSDFNFGTGAFTIDFWMYAGTASDYDCIVTVGGNPGHWGVYIVSHKITLLLNGGYHSLGTTVVDNQIWHHVAISKDISTNTVRLYVDGSKDGEVTDTTNFTSTNQLNIGSYYDTGYYYNGYIDELRIIKGYAIWTSESFTPSSIPYENLHESPNDYYSAVLTINGSIQTNGWLNINSAFISDNTDSQLISYAFSFDNRNTWKIWDADATPAAWRSVARNNSGTWQYNSADQGSTAWSNANVNTLTTAISEAVVNTNNQMTGADINNMSDTQWKDTGGWSPENSIALGIIIKSDSTTADPVVESYTMIYDSNEVVKNSSSDYKIYSNDIDSNQKLWKIKKLSEGTTKIFINSM